MQLYSSAISAMPKNQESTSSFPASDRSLHSITSIPLTVSAQILSLARSLSELIRLQVNADTAAHARSIPSEPFRSCECCSVLWLFGSLDHLLKMSTKIPPVITTGGDYTNSTVFPTNSPFPSIAICFGRS